MLNLIPAIMLLLMQGAGDADFDLRHQQALLDLATKVCSAQSHRELETVLTDHAGVTQADLAFWMHVLNSVGAKSSEPCEHFSQPIEPFVPPAPSDTVPSAPSLSSVRTRDGPVFS